MKKVFIIVLLIILLLIAIFTGVHFLNDKKSIVQDNEFKTDINVDGWLKITKIYEYDGKLAVEAENVSDIDVEYALLTVKNKNDSYTFNVSALLRGTKVALICNEEVGFNSNETYTGWQTENIINFKKTPVMNDDKYKVSVTDGSISIKNVSGEDIASDILIYYKEKRDDILNGSVTHRIRVSGLKADSQTYVKANDLNESNCQIIFTDYDEKKV